MFTQGTLGTYFTTVAHIRGQVPRCAGCSKPLSKHLWNATLHPIGVPSFWHLFCPHCRTSHIIFNDPNVLPPTPDDGPVQSRSANDLLGKMLEPKP